MAKKYLVVIKISKELPSKIKYFVADNPNEALFKANQFIDEKNLSSGKVVSLYEEIFFLEDDFIF